MKWFGIYFIDAQNPIHYFLYFRQIPLGTHHIALHRILDEPEFIRISPTNGCRFDLSYATYTDGVAIPGTHPNGTQSCVHVLFSIVNSAFQQFLVGWLRICYNCTSPTAISCQTAHHNRSILVNPRIPTANFDVLVESTSELLPHEATPRTCPARRYVILGQQMESTHTRALFDRAKSSSHLGSLVVPGTYILM